MLLKEESRRDGHPEILVTRLFRKIHICQTYCDLDNSFEGYAGE